TRDDDRRPHRHGDQHRLADRRRMIMRVLAVALLVCAALACSPELNEGRFACTKDQDCPESWTCALNRCYSSAAAFDASLRFDDAGTELPDASEPEDAGNCTSAASCDDHNPCTEDECETNGECRHTPRASCCNLDVECDDDDLCTSNTCDPMQHVC